MPVADPSGARRWVQRPIILGKRRDLGLGSCELAPLAEARERVRENRKTARASGDPRPKRRRVVPTFREAAEKVIEARRPTWTDGGKSEGQWRRSFHDHVFARLGERPVDAIVTAEVPAVLTPIRGAKPMTARRVRQRVDSALRWVVATGFSGDNPLAALNMALRPAQAPPRRAALAPGPGVH